MMGGFPNVFFMKFINIRPEYIRGLVGGVWGKVGCGKSLNKGARRHKFIVQSSYDMYKHPQRANIPLQGLNRLAVTVGALSGPYSQIGVLFQHHFTRRGFTLLAKSTLEKETTQHQPVEAMNMHSCLVQHKLGQ